MNLLTLAPGAIRAGSPEARELALWWLRRGVIICENCKKDLVKYHQQMIYSPNLQEMSKNTTQKTTARAEFDSRAYVLKGTVGGIRFGGDNLTNASPDLLHARLTANMPAAWIADHYAKHPALSAPKQPDLVVVWPDDLNFPAEEPEPLTVDDTEADYAE